MEKADAVLHAADRRTAPRARGEDFIAACLCLFDGLGNADTEIKQAAVIGFNRI